MIKKLFQRNWTVVVSLILILSFTMVLANYSKNPAVDQEHLDFREVVFHRIHNLITVYVIAVPFLTNNAILLELHMTLAILALVNWNYFHGECVYTKITNKISGKPVRGHVSSMMENWGIELADWGFKILEYGIIFVLIALNAYRLNISTYKVLEYFVVVVLISYLMLLLCRWIYKETFEYFDLSNGKEKNIRRIED